MQKCASPHRIPHAVPVNFPGGFYTSGCQVCTCSGFLHVDQQERMCKCLWAREVTWEQPWTPAVTVLAFQSMPMCTQRVLGPALFPSGLWLAEWKEKLSPCLQIPPLRSWSSDWVLPTLGRCLWERNNLLFFLKGPGRSLKDGFCVYNWWGGQILRHLWVWAGSPGDLI